ncbi:KICSTOR complex protein SZT2-like [Micropterus salmoides]|uniref:KICSTOR complex protein SZT2-like n=1 Tax=Micropterus salmoides TaxID=27706 RepID=UPI0018ED2393|nr:KICSTOR complex protein SZT2-like [Micropterus salmoides]
MHIEYLAAASWPLDPTKRTTRVEVTMEGSYDILHDISCTQRKPITSPYRTSVIRRFWNTLQSINQTDQMLVHLQSFNSIPENYMIPESTKNGVPLFYIPRLHYSGHQLTVSKVTKLNVEKPQKVLDMH